MMGSGMKSRFVKATRDAMKFVKYLYSGALLGFSVAIIMTGEQKGRPLPRAALIILFWVLICYLASIEGGQNCLVGLQPIKPEEYENSHRITRMSTKIAHLPGNIEKFIMGRQLLVVVVVFSINMFGSIHEGCSASFSTPEIVTQIFCNSGLALIFTTIMLGQLTSQIVATTCMLDFINNYLMVFTTYLSLAIEYSGILHSVHLVRLIFDTHVAKKVADDGDTKEESALEKLFFWCRAFISLLALGFAFAVVIREIANGRTTMWTGIPYGVSLMIFFLLMVMVGMLEGLQIALLAVVRMDQEQVKATHPMAHSMCEFAFRGSKLEAFLVGRQILVTIFMFILARITTIDANHEDFQDHGETTFGVSQGVQEFISTGLLAALITTIAGSLIFRVIASSAPLLFLSNPIINAFIRVCLALECTGIMHFSWVVAMGIKLLFRFSDDNKYLQRRMIVMIEDRYYSGVAADTETLMLV